jgi:surface antigen
MAGRAFVCAFALVAGLPLGGCAYQLGSAFERNKPEPGDITGSIAPATLNAQAATALPAPDKDILSDADMALARAAASEVLARGGRDSSQPWENPATGARGAVTPLASAYSAGGMTCRDFLVSHVQGRTETWLQGDACKAASGRWDVRALRPWKRT